MTDGPLLDPADELLEFTYDPATMVVVHFDETGIAQRVFGTPTGRLYRSLAEANDLAKKLTRHTPGFGVVLEVQEYSTDRWQQIRTRVTGSLTRAQREGKYDGMEKQ